MPAVKTEHITLNIPMAILSKGDGNKSFLPKVESTSLSLKGMDSRMSTASNVLSQAAGNVWSGYNTSNFWTLQMRTL